MSAMQVTGSCALRVRSSGPCRARPPRPARGPSPRPAAQAREGLRLPAGPSRLDRVVPLGDSTVPNAVCAGYGVLGHVWQNQILVARIGQPCLVAQ
jgi:hypothetical protein